MARLRMRNTSRNAKPMAIASELHPPPLLCVPPPVLTAILGYLEPSDLARASATCRTLHHLAVQDTLWRPLVKQFVDVVSQSGPSRLRTLLAKDNIRALIKQEDASTGMSFMRQYHDEIAAFEEQQRRKRVRINYSKEMRESTRRLIIQRKAYSDRFEAWKSCVLGNAMFRLYFYVIAIFLLAFLIMLHARLTYAPTLPLLAVLAPFSLIALACGTLWLVSAILYLPTARYRNDWVVRFRCGVALARRSVEYAVMFSAYGCGMVAHGVFILVFSVYYDAGGVSLDVCSADTPLILPISFSLVHLPLCNFIAIALSHHRAKSKERETPEYQKGFGFYPAFILSVVSADVLFAVLVKTGRTGSIFKADHGLEKPHMASVFGTFALSATVIVLYAVTAYLRTRNIIAVVSGALSVLLSVASLLLGSAAFGVSYDVVFVPVWLGWAMFLIMVVSLDVGGYLESHKVYSFLGSLIG